jgi:hypothetical protein
MHLDRPPRSGECPARRRLLAQTLGLGLALVGPVRQGAAAPSAAATTPAPVPVYPTRLPTAVALAYDMSYGPIGGSGRLEWQPPLAGSPYRLHLLGRALGLRLLEWVSEGGQDPAGLAPSRFVERRIGHDERVAEFRREAGRVRFPGGAYPDLPIPPGAQDRLSWLVQLPAILAADPALQAPGRSVQLFVVGVGGKGEAWTFVVEDVADGLVHLRRRAALPSEVVGEAWLSPHHQWMPLRVRLAKADGGDALELKLAR